MIVQSSSVGPRPFFDFPLQLFRTIIDDCPLQVVDWSTSTRRIDRVVDNSLPERLLLLLLLLLASTYLDGRYITQRNAKSAAILAKEKIPIWQATMDFSS